jgi:signal transduction histidine kinase/PAS domain-containing protein
MQRSGFPENERVEAIHRFAIQDPEQEEEYNDLTKLAAQICGKKSAFISFLDSDRHWIKASFNLNSKETDRIISFCGCTINSSEGEIIVNDSSKDERFFDNSLVQTEGGTLFYAGVSILDQDGVTLGTISVTDERPGEISPEQLFALRTISKSVATLLKESRNRILLTEYRKDLEVVIEYCSPFNIIIDHDGKIERVGRKLTSILGRNIKGESLIDHFIIDDRFDLRQWSENSNQITDTQLYFLETKDGIKKFKFTAYKFEYRIFFSLNPVVNTKYPLSTYQLTLKDFSPQDYIVEYLFLMQTIESALKDSKKVIDGIVTKSKEVKKAQKEIELITRIPEENPNPIIRVDYNLKITFANKAANNRLFDFFNIDNDTINDNELTQLIKGLDFERETKKEVVIVRNGCYFKLNIVLLVEYINIYVTEITTFIDETNRLKEFYELILDNFPLDIGVFDAEHRYLYINKEGIKNPEVRNFMIGKTDYDYCDFRNLSYDLADIRRARFNNAISNRAKESWFDKHIMPDEKEKVIQRQYIPIINESNRIEYVVGYGIDITDLSNAQNALSDQLKLMNVLQEITSSFVGAEMNSFKNVVQENLTKIGHFLGADRVYFYSYHFDENLMIMENEWAEYNLINNSNPASCSIDILPEERIKPHLNGQSFVVNDVRSLKQSFYKDQLLELELKSFSTSPCISHGECLGFIGVDFVKDYRILSEKELLLLEVFAQIVGNGHSAMMDQFVIAQRNEVISKMNSDLEIQVQLKSEENHELTLMLANLDKMAMIGEVTANIAHDLNTPMGAIKAASESINYVLENLFYKSASDFSKEQLTKAYLREIKDLDITIGGFQIIKERKSWLSFLKDDPRLDGEFLENIIHGLIKARVKFEEKELLEDILNSNEPLNYLNLIYSVLLIRSFNDTILLSTERASDVIKDLRFYIKEGGKNEKELVDLRESLQTVLKIFRFETSKGIEISLEIEGNTMITGYKSKLYQVWSNIIKNGIDAMDNNGKIIIRIKEENDFRTVSIENNGPKIPDDVLPNIFNKFYSTKDSSKGTGLGLNIVKEIIDEHLAKIIVSSTEYRTIFKVFFPK